LSGDSTASVIVLDLVGFDTGNTTRDRLDGFDFTVLVECLLDQGDDSLSSESRVLRIEQDLSFELALIIADGAARSIWTGISGDLNGESLWIQVGHKPMADANVVVGLDGITNVCE
jgi:hypothetical protein